MRSMLESVPDEGFRNLVNDAAKGIPAAEDLLAQFYLMGVRVPRNDKQGQRLFTAQYALLLDESAGTFSISHEVRDPKTQERRTAEYAIFLDTTRPHLGGRRWWFRCPYTSRRAMKLYLFPSSEKFCCRTALHPAPTYLIQRVSGLKKATLRRWALRERMGSDDSLFTLSKPKGMHHRTFAEYQLEDSLLERDELLVASRHFGFDVSQFI
jgi:hypothetical protein